MKTVQSNHRTYRQHVGQDVVRLAELIAHTASHAAATADLIDDNGTFTTGELADAQAIVTALRDAAKRAYLLVVDLDPTYDPSDRIASLGKPSQTPPEWP